MRILTNMRSWGLSMAALLFATGIACAETPSPKVVYGEYLKALGAANKVEDIMPFVSKKTVEKINATPAEQRPVMFMLMKNFRPTNVKVESETIEGDKASLKLTASTDQPKNPSAGMQETTTGKVDFVREGTDWKIDHEAYDSKFSSDKTDPAGSTPDHAAGSTPDHAAGSTPDHAAGSTPDHAAGSTPDHAAGAKTGAKK